MKRNGLKKVMAVILSAIMLMMIMQLCAFAVNNENISVLDGIPANLQQAIISNDKIAASVDETGDLYSITVTNTDSSKSLFIYQTKIKYIEDGVTKYIDTSIKKSEKSEYKFESSANEVKSFFPDSTSDFIKFAVGDYAMEFMPAAGKDLKANLADDKNSVTYGSKKDDLYYRYTSTFSGVKEEIILNSFDGNNKFDFIVKFTNLVPEKIEGDAISLLDSETGEVITAISPVDVRDSYDGESGAHISLCNKIEFREAENGTYIFTYTVDEQFLKAESTVYPVIIDPFITINEDPIYDAPVFSGYPSSNFNSNIYNSVGYENSEYGEAITFIKINNIQNYLYINPELIYSAQLCLYENSGKTSGATVRIYDVRSTWNNTTITYNNKPNLWSEQYGHKNITTPYLYYNFSITGFVKNWLNYALNDGGMSQEHGLALKMSMTGVSSRWFASATNALYPPYLVISYEEDESVTSGFYRIRSKYSGLYLDTELNASANGNVIQYTNTGGDNQLWNICNNGDGEYQLLSFYYNNNKCLYVANSSPYNGANVTVTGNSASAGTRFRIIKNADNTYRILSKCDANDGELVNYGLDVTGPSLNPTANIQTWRYSGVSQQRWYITRVV